MKKIHISLSVIICFIGILSGILPMQTHADKKIINSNDCETEEAAAVCHLLQDPGSTTSYFKKICPNSFHVVLLQQSWRQMTKQECKLLQCKKNATQAMVREVLLKCGTQNLMYALSIFPEQTLQGAGSQFKQLGNRSLGEILFQDPNLRRENVALQKIANGEPAYAQMQPYLPQNKAVDYLWERQSIFYFHQNPLYVYEVYLPPLLDPLRQLDKSNKE